MSTIRDLSRMSQRRGQPPTTWRDELLPANFDGFPFHVEAGARESGRRIALHEFPKKELPYAEDMGHIAVAFTVRGYIVVYPSDDGGGSANLYQRDYRFARDALQERLDRGGPGVLQLPTFVRFPMNVVCTRYRLTEEEKAGGYCTFDMQFVERGKKPFAEQADTQGDLYAKTYALRLQVQAKWAQESNQGKRTYLGPYNPLVRFVGKPNKLGPIRTKPTSPQSEFTSGVRALRNDPRLGRFKPKDNTSDRVPGF